MIAFAQKVVNALGKIFGWEMEVNTKGLAIDDDAIEDGADAMGNLGDAADKASKSTKELNKQLQGFDKLNVLTTKKDNSSSKKKDDDSKSGTGTAVVDTGDATAALKKTKGVFESEIDNLFDLGRYISDSLSKQLEKINWNAVYEKARSFGAGLANFLNGLITPRLFYNVGRTISSSISTAFHFLDSFGQTFDWKNFGKSIGAGINGFLAGFDWATIKSAAKNWGSGLADTIMSAVEETDFHGIGEALMHALDTALTFAFELGSGLDFTEIGTRLADGINGAIENFPAEKFANTIDEWVQGLWDMIVSCLSQIHWDDLGEKIKEFVGNIDPKTWRILVGGILLLKGTSLAVSIGKELLSAISKKFIEKLAAKLMGDMGTSPVLGKAIGDGLGKAAEGAGGGAMLGEATASGGGFLSFLGGVISLLSGAGLAVGSFVDQWKNGWSLISEILKWIGLAIAAVGAVILGAPALVAGVVAGIVGAVMGLVILIKEKWADIKKFFVGVWQGIQGFFGGVGKFLGGVWSGVQKGIGNFVQGAREKFGSFVQGARDKFGQAREAVVSRAKDIRDKASGAFNTLREKAGGAFNTLKEKGVTAFENLKSGAQSKWTTIKDTIGGAVERIRDGAVSKFESLRDKAGDLFGKIQEKARSKWSSIRDTIGGLMDGARDKVGGAIQKIRSFFNFKWSLPKLKLPHVQIHGKFSLVPPSIPTFSIKWYKRAYNNPMLFGDSTILPTANGFKGFGDGNGGELVYGHANLMDDIREATGGSQMSAIGNRQLANDQRIIQLLTIIAEKEFGISQDAVFRAVRNSASDYTMRTGRGAFEF